MALGSRMFYDLPGAHLDDDRLACGGGHSGSGYPVWIADEAGAYPGEMDARWKAGHHPFLPSPPFPRAMDGGSDFDGFAHPLALAAPFRKALALGHHAGLHHAFEPGAGPALTTLHHHHPSSIDQPPPGLVGSPALSTSDNQSLTDWCSVGYGSDLGAGTRRSSEMDLSSWTPTPTGSATAAGNEYAGLGVLNVPLEHSIGGVGGGAAYLHPRPMPPSRLGPDHGPPTTAAEHWMPRALDFAPPPPRSPAAHDF
ncbi:MAG: hypothetical protein M1826_006837, partial [Phylliscum demangeonii]